MGEKFFIDNAGYISEVKLSFSLSSHYYGNSENEKRLDFKKYAQKLIAALLKKGWNVTEVGLEHCNELLFFVKNDDTSHVRVERKDIGCIKASVIFPGKLSNRDARNVIEKIRRTIHSLSSVV